MKLNRIRKSFGSLCVLDGVSADLEEGGVTAVLGPSGCGKTTLLRICAGLIEPDDPPDSALKELRARRSGFLFQEPRLLPWETAQANVELVLHDRPANERREIAGKLLE
ncbi:ATP-binding cassette domain-containing protein, partial [Salinispira pacifica]